jgi:pilus assembly protein CpaB
MALLAALAISIAITSIFYYRVKRQNAAARAKTRRIVVATAAISPGVAVAEENLADAEWPENLPLEGMIEKKEEIVGKVLVYAVAAREPILKRDLAAGGSLGLAAKIPDGMRATAIKTNEVNNVAGFLFPGAHVDVLVTLRGDTNNNSSTRTVLQNVVVLSTGAKMEPDPNGKPENVTVVTLLVNPEDSQKLVLAQNQGTIQFVLRNTGDSMLAETPSVDVAQLAGLPKKEPVPEMRETRKARVVATKPRSEYVVETVAGGKTTVAKFAETPQ